MTSASDLDRLALQVQLPGFAGTTLSAEAARLLADGLGGICLFGTNTAAGPDAIAAYTAAMRACAERPLVAIDEEGGDVTRLHAATGSPFLGPAALGRADDVALTAATAHGIGAELAVVGINLDLAPCADVNSNPDNPVIGVRSFGAEPYGAARHVAAWTEGLQRSGVSACVKHFPGHGDTTDDSHLDVPVVAVSAEILATRELVPFRAAIASGVDAVMTSHLVVPALDDQVATLSVPVLALLREQLGFDGAIVTDALDMAGASHGRGIPRAAVLALRAGADLLCLGNENEPDLVRAVQAEIVAAVRSGELASGRLVEAAARSAGLGRPAGAADADLGPGPGTGAGTGPAGQRAGAHLALCLDGDLPDLAGSRTVRVESTPNIAVGAVAWGLAGEPATDEAIPADWATDPRSLVLQVREAHRRPGVRSLLARRTSAGLPTLVLEWGWPGPLPVRVPRLCTYGASVPSRDAAVEVLESRGWTA